MLNDFPATREAALARLTEFAPKAGGIYARQRNFDLPGHPHVSGLSPYVRRRLVTEAEVLEATLAEHSSSSAEKFIQEVFWRTYWKGWLERRPSVWTDYKAGLNAAFNRVQTEAGLRAKYADACGGKTEIDCFNSWSQELVNTGYLHNHARMWFASIWIFTLQLPWQLGADFFLRHLLDGDPASNTLSWRWVAGLQTFGKTYLARPHNIEKYTNGRFFLPPGQLADVSVPLDGMPHPPLGDVPKSDRAGSHKSTGLILHDDDLDLEHLLGQVGPNRPFIRITSVAQNSPRAVGALVETFAHDALEHSVRRNKVVLGEDCGLASSTDNLLNWVVSNQLEQVALVRPTVGPAQDHILPMLLVLEENGIKTAQIIPPYDTLCWPHATAGFFKFKTQIPKLISALNLKTRQGDLFA